MTTIEVHDFVLPIKSERDLADFARLAFGAVIPDVKVCKEHTTPWRAFCDAYFARSPVSVWKASRGFGGKSYLLALLGLVEAVTLKVDVNVLGGSGEQSVRVHEHMSAFWQHDSAPRYLLGSEPEKLKTKLAWGNSIRALMASSKSVRGPHPVRLRLDEIDEMDLTILDAAMGQPMDQGDTLAQTVMSSTHQYADGTMTEILKRTAQRSWPVYQWCYKETSADPTGWLATDEIERKRLQVTRSMWDTEYELQEPSPESRAIQPAAVKRMFTKKLGKYAGAPQQYIEIEPPQKGAQYLHGADWARKQDWTIIVTIRKDRDPAQVVAFERTARLPWPVMVKKLDDRIQRYGGYAFHDGTGIGDVVAGYLNKPARPVMMVGRARSDLLSNYIGACERGEVVAPVIAFMESEHRLASVDDIYGKGHLPDSIAAMALAWMGMRAGITVASGADIYQRQQQARH